MVEVVLVEDLEVDALRAQGGVPTDLLDHLVGSAGECVRAQVVRASGR